MTLTLIDSGDLKQSISISARCNAALNLLLQLRGQLSTSESDFLFLASFAQKLSHQEKSWKATTLSNTCKNVISFYVQYCVSCIISIRSNLRLYHYINISTILPVLPFIACRIFQESCRWHQASRVWDMEVKITKQSMAISVWSHWSHLINDAHCWQYSIVVFIDGPQTFYRRWVSTLLTTL